jgi:glutaminyl-peptide cyclotransferase
MSFCYEKYTKAMRIFGAGLFLLVSCAVPPAGPVEEEFSGQRAFSHVEQQLRFGPRIPGSKGHELAGDWIHEELQKAGWMSKDQIFEKDGVPIRNIIAVQNANQPSEAPILIGTHYDTRPYADQDYKQPMMPVPGANDGASGVGVLLELARVLKEKEVPVWLVFFDAEDSGRINDWEWSVGASYFAENLETRPRAVIVVDMVGDSDLEIRYERNSNADLSGEIWEIAADEGYANTFVSERRSAIIDDHIPFIQKGIPASLIIDLEYPFWHTTEDTADKVSAQSLEIVGRTIQAYLEQAAR